MSGPAQQPSNNPRYAFNRLHDDIRVARGRAAEHDCVDCGKKALDWSQVHGTDGSDLHKHFDPRCRSCHKKYDHTAEISQKMRAASLGKPKSIAHRRNISIARYLEELI